jgi:hypothetical protein
MWDNFGRLLLALGGILVASGALIMFGDYYKYNPPVSSLPAVFI